MAEVLTDGAICNALDAIATWAKGGGTAEDVPLPPHVQDAMEAVRSSHEGVRAMLRKVLASRPRGCRDRTVLEMLPAATAREVEEVGRG